MCHQTVGLVQRTLEQRGVPTVSLSNLKQRSMPLNLPRVLFTRLERGQTVGQPHDADGQRATLTAALALLEANNPDDAIRQHPARDV